ncbi:AlbA family DNA-binding domain-containing protein [Acinetobacter parvus]|uniref:AlbA family DNA-binding domain-containing protein n=1 Tax=Acinetobacter parvus TaxID=134533 RepID=UPI0021D206A5|nr:helix-turn-helix domain-containing protein [Acinetobacter parvus]MCU4394663.1 helix-turn-helix domain-containing protein [Acinetobacter parvus]
MSSDQPLLLEIQKGESKTLEFKQQLPKGQQIAKTLIAFANGSGGKLIVGVTDDRQLVGIQDDIFELQDKITSMIYELCAPQLAAQIYIENIDGVELLVVEVARGSLFPYYLKPVGREQGTYIRLGASNRVASPEHIQQLELQRLNISFDALANYQYPLEKLNLTVLEEAFKAADKTLTLEKMLNLKLVIEEQGQRYASHGLLILLGQYEHVMTQCARFKGTNMSVFLDRKEYTGDLFSQIEQAEIFIKNHLSLRAEIRGLKRYDYLEIPENAIREALVNAYVHRDYSNFGRNIKVAVYDDLVNIVSPGGLPNGLTEADLLQGRSEIRNRVLARVFRELGYIEHWGSGLQRIKQMCEAENLPTPEFLETNDFFDVKLYRPVIESESGAIGGAIGGAIDDSSGVIEDLGGAIEASQLTERQQEILVLIRANPKVSYRSLAEQLGINQSALQKHLNHLKDAGWLERMGGTRGYWAIKKEFGGEV